MATPGTAMIVLAHHRRVFSITTRPAPGHTLAECIAQSVEYAKGFMGDDDPGKLARGALCFVIKDLIKKHGWVPSHDKHADLDNEHNASLSAP
jgi:hypothetical protein